MKILIIILGCGLWVVQLTQLVLLSNKTKIDCCAGLMSDDYECNHYGVDVSWVQILLFLSKLLILC